MAEVQRLGPPTYRRIDDGWEWERDQIERLDESGRVERLRIVFRAERLRQERRHEHALVTMLANNVALDSDDLALHKGEERSRLAKRAQKHLNGFADLYPLTYIEHDLMSFCRGVWEQEVNRLGVEECAGLPEPRITPTVVYPWVVEGGGSIFYAPPGRGKSWLGLLMAVSIDAGAAIPEPRRLWRVAHPQKVVFINLERDRDSVLNRLGAVNAALGLPRTRPLAMLHARGRTLDDVLPALKRAVRQRGIQLPILDSISRAGMGDLTNATDANRIMDTLNALTRTWVALAHTPRGSEDHTFGSQMFDAAADVQVKVVSEQLPGEPMGLGLHLTKGSDLPKVKSQVLELQFDAAGLTGVRPARAGDYPAAEGRKEESLRQQVIGYLADTGKADATRVAAELGFSRSKIVETLADRATFIKLPKEGRQQPYGLRQ